MNCQFHKIRHPVRMKASNEELTTVVVKLTSILASMMEFNVTLAKIAVPLATHLTEVEKYKLLSELEQMPMLAKQLRESCDQLTSQDQEQTANVKTEKMATKKELQELPIEAEHTELKARAEAGDVAAQIKIADIYCYGWGVSEDKQKAIFWYKKAIEQGSVKALVESESCFTETLGNEAVEFYRQLAETGNTEAQLVLASLYDEGKCVPKNDEEAFRLRLQAAELNNGQACNLAGSALVTGDGVEKNTEEGIKWLLKVANPKTTTSDFDMDDAQLSLSEAYADPEYPKRDLVEAYKWLNLLMADCPNENFRLELVEKRDALASSMTREQIEEAQSRSSELFVPRDKILERLNSKMALH
jgi:hypothetical protein